MMPASKQNNAILPFPLNRPPSEPDSYPALRSERIALVHDWCPDFRGGERVLAELCRMARNRDVFTLFDFLPEAVKAEHFAGVAFHPSPANRLPGIRHFYRNLFFACPFLIEQFDVTGFDAVITSSAAFSRGVITRPDQPHLCYIHSPVRYAWDEQFSYIHQAGLGFGPKGLLYRYMLHRLRQWDVRTAHGPDVMLANSRYVQARVRHIYGRDAEVVHPPVPLHELRRATAKDDYYVTASFLAPYKRTDLVIQAFRDMPSKRLVVVGEGQQSASLRALAGPNVSFAGYLPRTDFIDVLGRAKALVFAGCEDFGIALAEAQGCGTPVIAFGRGGVRDIVRPLGEAEAPTGVLFKHQTVEAVRDALERFETAGAVIRPDSCAENAARFSPQHFQRAINKALDRAIACHGG